MIKSLVFILSSLALCCQAKEKTDDRTLVKQLLTEDLSQRSFLFSQVIESSSGKKVLPFNKQKLSHGVVLAQIKSSIKKAIAIMNQAHSPIKKLRRINEASRYFENILLTEINKHPDLNCSIPLNKEGKTQRSGYPDLRIFHVNSETVFYLDPKLYEEKSRASGFRTFYYEPKTRTTKILDNAVHLLLGISHDGIRGNWKFTSWELVDLSQFKVRLKAEFQASNKDLYTEKNVIESSLDK